MPPLVRFTVTHRFRHPPAEAYAWLTDYSPDDARLSAGVIAGRRVLSRSDGVVRLETRVNTPRGERTRVQEARLDPARLAYEVRVVDGYGKGGRHTYTVTPAPGGRSDLTVLYGYGFASWGEWLVHRLGRRRMRATVERMWDGFEKGMDEELGLTRTSPSG